MTEIAEIPASMNDGGEERLEINLGRRCNQRCIFCMENLEAGEKAEWVALDVAKAELAGNLRERKYRALGLLGGEPTLYPDLVPLVRYAKELGVELITINTNGFGLSRPDFARELLEAGLNRVCFSIHSQIPAVEDELSSVKGAYLRKLKAVRNMWLLKRREFPHVQLSLNAVINNHNLPTLDEYLRFYSHIGFDDIRLNFIRPEGRALAHPGIVPRMSDAVRKLMELVELNERHLHLHLSFGELPYCVYPREFFSDKDLRRRYIGEWRDLRTRVHTFDDAPRMMESRPEENRARESFVWQNQKNDKLKRLAPACQTCSWADICGGVWVNYLRLHGVDEFTAMADENGDD